MPKRSLRRRASAKLFQRQVVELPPRTTSCYQSLTTVTTEPEASTTPWSYSSSQSSVTVDSSPFRQTTQAELDKLPLKADQVRSMFVGAPCFSVEECNGKKRPCVEFRGSDIETSASFPTDHRALEHPTFAASTIASQIVTRSTVSPYSNDENSDDAEGSLDETPDLRSYHGLDPGTVGFHHFLRRPTSSDSADRRLALKSERKRGLLAANPKVFGLRKTDVAMLMVRLSELKKLRATHKGTSGAAAIWTNGTISAMGEALFRYLLDGPSGSVETQRLDLNAQIMLLQRILEEENLWHDFGAAASHATIDRLLWDESCAGEIDFGRSSERGLLLLQITLAGELLTRMDIVAHASTLPHSNLTHSEIALLNRSLSGKTQRDLIFAEKFLDTVDIVSQRATGPDQTLKQSTPLRVPGYRLAQTPTKNSFRLETAISSTDKQTQQLDGLVHFARAIGWPHTEDLLAGLYTTHNPKLEDRPLSTVTSLYMTPPPSPPPNASSETLETFFVPEVSTEKRACFQDSHWRSRIWLSGLTLPEDSTGDLLMGTLLESSQGGTTSTGLKADLTSGFTYGGRHYLSKKSIVARVLAAKAGASDCMGWISAPGFHGEHKDEWRNVRVKNIPDTRGVPRLEAADDVAKDSDLLHNFSIATSLTGDFTKPHDKPVESEDKVICQGLSFNAVRTPPNSRSSNHSISTASSVACLSFNPVSGDKTTKQVEYQLTYDAYFITSYPCHPRDAKSRSRGPATRLRPSDSPYSIATRVQRKDSGFELDQLKASPPPSSQHTRTSTPSTLLTLASSASDKELSTPPVHSLHKDYHFDTIPAAALLQIQTQSRHEMSSPGLPTEREKDVMVIDCRAGDDSELLARAWCAKVGEHAVIGKSGRTCLACCVREARALGICVVLRT